MPYCNNARGRGTRRCFSSVQISTRTLRKRTRQHEHVGDGERRIHGRRYRRGGGQLLRFPTVGLYTPATKLLQLNEPGLFIVERCLALGVCSYRPMLNMLGESGFGDTNSVQIRWQPRGGRPQAQCDRPGFMHNRWPT